MLPCSFIGILIRTAESTTDEALRNANSEFVKYLRHNADGLIDKYIFFEEGLNRKKAEIEEEINGEPRQLTERNVEEYKELLKQFSTSTIRNDADMWMAIYELKKAEDADTKKAAVGT